MECGYIIDLFVIVFTFASEHSHCALSGKIHRNERGRQGKFRAIALKGELGDKKRIAAAESHVAAPEDVATSDIQRVFRGHCARLVAEAAREEELIILGMKPAPGTVAADDTLAAELWVAQVKRKTEQQENKGAFAKALVDLKAEVHRDEGPLMKDWLRQERHLWVTDKIAETKEILVNPPTAPSRQQQLEKLTSYRRKIRRSCPIPPNLQATRRASSRARAVRGAPDEECGCKVVSPTAS